MFEFLKKSKLFAFFMIMIVMLHSGHAFYTVISGVNLLLYIPFIIGFIWLVLTFRTGKLDKLTTVLLLFILMIGFTFVVNAGRSFSYYFTLISIIFGAYAISEMYSFEKMIRVYLWIMTLVSAVALVGYILVSTTNVLSILPSVDSFNDFTYKTAFIYSYITTLPERNCGMFWEPGLFATHLTLAILFEMMTKDRPNILRLILFSVCIFTANSSAGFALWFLCLLLFFVRKSRKGVAGVLQSIFSLVLLVGAIFVILNFDTILTQTSLGDNEYFQKLSSESISSSSRSNAIGHNLKLFLQYPIFGAGIGTVTKNMEYVADNSTSTYLMSIFGIMGVLYTVFWIYGIAKLRGINILSKIIIATIVLIILNKEPHIQMLFTWILLFYFVKLDTLKCPIKEKQQE